ncbi:zinc finger, CCHC-type containing protein [Tanacetum coccineum]|uniref:Zinc finger, CCHC-type containing protein n=1 Tax=Tanacetum coccineum TaxID=301880 RepID=A0ABQ5EHY3_9ASTR
MTAKFATILSSIKDKILAAQNEAFEAVNAPAEMLQGLDDQMERRSDGAFPFSSTTMETRIIPYSWRLLPSLADKGDRNTIELPVGNNVVPLRSDTIWLVQNGCSFHGLQSEDPNQHLKDFLKTSSNWLERFLAGSITTWEDLTTRFLAQLFPPGRTAKLRNDIMMFQQHQGESLSEAWTS